MLFFSFTMFLNQKTPEGLVKSSDFFFFVPLLNLSLGLVLILCNIQLFIPQQVVPIDRDASRWLNPPVGHVAGVKHAARLPSAGYDLALGFTVLQQLMEND